MPEDLRTPTNIKLYGRVMIDLAITAQPTPPPGLGSNKFLAQQLTAAGGAPTLARIYGFSYEGHYYDLPKPAIFLVHGVGTAAGPTPPELAHQGKDGKFSGKAVGRGSVAPGNADESGVAAKSWDFSEDMVFWEYDKSDFSIRFDIETGPFEQILLEAAISIEKRQYYSGADLRVAGADLRVAGADLRIRRNRGGD
jgi:hypothetical protein